MRRRQGAKLDSIHGVSHRSIAGLLRFGVSRASLPWGFEARRANKPDITPNGQGPRNVASRRRDRAICAGVAQVPRRSRPYSDRAATCCLRSSSDHTFRATPPARGGAWYLPILEFQYAQERGSMIPGGAWSSASRNSSSGTYRRMIRISSGRAEVIAYAMKRTGSASACSGDSNQTMLRATVRVSGVNGIGFMAYSP